MFPRLRFISLSLCHSLPGYTPRPKLQPLGFCHIHFLFGSRGKPQYQVKELHFNPNVSQSFHQTLVMDRWCVFWWWLCSFPNNFIDFGVSTISKLWRDEKTGVIQQAFHTLICHSCDPRHPRLSRVDLSWNRLGLACAKNQNPSKVRRLRDFAEESEAKLGFSGSCEGGNVQDKQRFLKSCFFHCKLWSLVGELVAFPAFQTISKEGIDICRDHRFEISVGSRHDPWLLCSTLACFSLKMTFASWLLVISFCWTRFATPNKNESSWGDGVLLWPDACGSVGHEQQALSSWHLIQRHWNRGPEQKNFGVVEDCWTTFCNGELGSPFPLILNWRTMDTLPKGCLAFWIPKGNKSPIIWYWLILYILKT